MKRIAVITGATRGLGFELAQRLLGEGFRVVAMGRQLDKLASEQAVHGPALRAMHADLGSEVGIRAAGDELLRLLDGESVHCLVHCAGIVTPIAAVTDITLDDFQQLMNVNFFAAFHLTNVLIPRFADGARVLAVSSRAAQRQSPGVSLYCASKAALESLIGSYQAELARVGVSACIPGEVDTDMQADLREGSSAPLQRAEQLRGSFDQRFFLDNQKRLIPPAVSARFLHWLLVGPDREEFASRKTWVIYDREVQPRWLEAGEVFPYEPPP